EPYAVKVARTVLRRAALGNKCRLSDKNELVPQVNSKAKQLRLNSLFVAAFFFDSIHLCQNQIRQFISMCSMNI
ncbi:hypothetical protein L9W98_14215, partial [Vibrio aestuarianus]|nr:hypothetical protein [Vibrio aestuarianus]MDE1297644.1 hypothetical protein [Vibrio aestuarianus]